MRPITGTEEGLQPFFSPDGQSLAFFTRDGTLKKMSLAGGQPVTLVRDMPFGFLVLGTWTDDSTRRSVSSKSPNDDSLTSVKV